MSFHDKTILVAGATGKQGGAVARRLLSDGWRVRALTRDDTQPAARELAETGVEVVTGDLDDRVSLDAAARGVFGVFAVHSGAYAGNEYMSDPEHEIRSGVNLADAATAAGAQHIVYSSSIGIGNPELESALSMLPNKRAVEEHVRSGKTAATILRPTSFMENYLHTQRGLVGGALVTPLNADTPEPLIAVDDIAAFAALAFAEPQTHAGRIYELAGDVLTQREIAATLSEVTGRDVPYVNASEAVAERSPEAARALGVLNRVAIPVDLAAVSRVHPGVLTFRQWAQRHVDRLLTVLARS